MRTVDSALGESNNFDALRFLAAIGVVLSHAYPVSLGSNANEFLALMTGGETTLGELCVMVFFIISGFLITQSFDRSDSLIDFMTNRVIRIVPALSVVVVISCFALGPIVTSQTTEAYWSSLKTYRYLANCLIYPAAQQLPGVFDENIYRSVVNASLWTLSYEFSCYTCVAAIGQALRKAWLSSLLMLLFTVASVFMTWISPRIFLIFSGYFFAGGIVYLLRRHVCLDIRLLVGSLAVLATALAVKTGFEAAVYVFGTYSIIYAAYSPRLGMRDFARHGDLSYGIYIYAFPIQQLLAPYTSSVSSNFLASTMVILLCAFFSWHVVEKPALSRKRQASNVIRKLFRRQRLSTAVEGEK